MAKLVAISGYDAALPEAYQDRRLGSVGCGCAGGSPAFGAPAGVGKLYTLATQQIQIPGGASLPAATVQVDIPVEQMAQDANKATRMERWATAAVASAALLFGVWLIVGRR